MPEENIRYAGFPSAVMYEQAVTGKSVKKKPVQHLLWGDWLTLKGGTKGDWLEVHARAENGWIHKDSIQTERLLEITFVDIGQGDGCLISTPKDAHMLVDAGESDNMYRFLRWKFAGFDKEFKFESIIITHPDADHYFGFDRLFGDLPHLRFGTIYHNGIVERNAKSKEEVLGRTGKDGKTKYLLEPVRDKDTLLSLLEKEELIKKRQYATMLKKALDTGRVDNISMLSAIDKYLPGYGPENPISIEVLGPVPEPDMEGTPRLRWFGNVAKTKNGHSIILRLRYGRTSILLGGDLNIPAEHFLLSHYAGLECPPKTSEIENQLIESARRTFESEVTKSCHHGSGDFTDLFLDAINPLATVISSGDEESYSHPRSDALGAIGRHSRSGRPLIFSTELARSAKEIIKHPAVLREKAKELEKAVEEAKDEDAKKKAKAKYDEFVEKQFQRSIAVYGAINLRTDGNDVVIAQKIESPRSKDKKWDIYALKRDPSGVLRYEPESD